MKPGLLVLIPLFLTAPAVWAEDPVEPLFEQDFEQIEGEMAPDEILILEGEFSVVSQEDGNKALHLPGTPLSDYCALFGPAKQEQVEVSARILSERQRRQYPRFGVGLNGVNGFKLFVTPSKRSVELYQGKDVVSTVEFEWKSGEWTNFILQNVKVDSGWVIKCKVWQGEEEPEKPILELTVQDEPVNGKPSIWGTPYSSQPIIFDDLIVKPLE